MSTAATTATATRTTWNIDAAHSQVEFAVRHMMISTVRGRFAGVKGTVVTDDSDPARAEVDVVIDVNSIDTREPQRDAHLKSADFFDAEKFPVLTFKGTRVTGAQGDQFKLVGDLTIHGVTREVTLDVTSEGRATDPWGGERAGYSAVTRINRREFGLTWNQALETGGLIVGDEIKISLDLELVKA
jgi:polyisoprenoid-binding protein YceI